MSAGGIDVVAYNLAAVVEAGDVCEVPRGGDRGETPLASRNTCSPEES